MSITVSHTSRGFQIINFEDHNGQKCSLQQSSIAIYQEPGTGAVWLGVDGPEGGRMHLNEDQVGMLLPALQNWLLTGYFDQEG